MMFRRFACFVFVFLTCFPAAARPEGLQEVKVAFAVSPGIVFFGKNSTVEGLYVDVLKQVFETELGMKVTMVERPWKRAQNDVRLGRADIMITVPTPDRLAYTHVVEPAVHVLQRSLFTSHNHSRLKEISHVSTIADIAKLGLKMTTNIGDGWHKKMVAGTTIETLYVPDLTHSFLLVSDGRADLVVASRATAKNIMDTRGLQGMLVETTGKIPEAQAHILVSKQSPLAADIDKINAAVETLVADGRLEQIRLRYIDAQQYLD